jgi:hypothetical protein
MHIGWLIVKIFVGREWTRRIWIFCLLRYSGVVSQKRDIGDRCERVAHL